MYTYLANTGIKMYDLFNVISIAALLITNMTTIKIKKNFLSNAAISFTKQRLKKRKKTIFANRLFMAGTEIFFISLVQYGLVPVINQCFGNLIDTGINYFGALYFMPAIVMIYFYIIKIAPLKQFDLITPAYAIALFFVKIACFCCGCCYGIEWKNGLYNFSNDQYEFPVQLVEAALALLLFVFLLCYRKKAKEGTLMPVYIILYSATRFFSEFLRQEENILWIFKKYHILCIIGIISGIIELLIVLRYKDKINQLYAPRKRIKF